MQVYGGTLWIRYIAEIGIIHNKRQKFRFDLTSFWNHFGFQSFLSLGLEKYVRKFNSAIVYGKVT